MKANKTIKCILPCMTMLVLAMAQVHASESTCTAVSGEVTPKMYYFNYTGGPGAGFTPYLQSYSGQESWSGNRDDGFYAALDLNLNLNLSCEQDNSLTLRRRDYGLDNHRGSIKGGGADIGYRGYYSHYRTNTSGVKYVHRPGTVDNPTDPLYTAASSGMVSNFSDDGLGQANYHVERTRYGVGVKFKPGLLGKGTSLSINFDGYNRDGNKFATWVAGNGDFIGDTRYLDRWRGYDNPVDENMGKISLNFTASPGGMFQFSYDGSYEKFNNKTPTVLIGDFASFLNYSTLNPNSADTPLHFIPDSTLMTHALRITKSFGATAVALGYGMSTLEQDSFLDVPLADRFVGEIATENAFFNVNHRLSRAVGIEGFVKYHNRDNDSSTQADGLDRSVRDEWGVRIANIESLSYGLSANFRDLPVKSTLTAGWKREDSDRNLQWNSIPAADNIGQWPTVSLYREETVADEIYLKWVARPVPGMILRVTPAFIWADKTAFVTLPEESLNLKTALSYVLTDGTLINLYYNFKDKKNTNQGFTDTIKPASGVITLGPEYSQKADDTFHAAGASLNLTPTEHMNASVSLDWVQNDSETYFFGTNRRRFETDIVFDPRGMSAFKADTWSLSFNGDYQADDRLLLTTGYTFSKTDDGYLRTTGTTTSGDIGDVNDKIDYTLHSFIFGVNYSLKKNIALRGDYSYDKYEDDTFGALSGGVHTFMVGLTFIL